MGDAGQQRQAEATTYVVDDLSVWSGTFRVQRKLFP